MSRAARADPVGRLTHQAHVVHLQPPGKVPIHLGHVHSGTCARKGSSQKNARGAVRDAGLTRHLAVGGAVACDRNALRRERTLSGGVDGLLHLPRGDVVARRLQRDLDVLLVKRVCRRAVADRTAGSARMSEGRQANESWRLGADQTTLWPWPVLSSGLSRTETPTFSEPFITPPKASWTVSSSQNTLIPSSHSRKCCGSAGASAIDSARIRSVIIVFNSGTVISSIVSGSTSRQKSRSDRSSERPAPQHVR
eukprot:COSAG04_NODE_112_length_25760_cov_5.835977_2_plen_252_part_00